MAEAICVHCRAKLSDANTKFCPFCNAQQFGFVTPIDQTDEQVVKCPKCHGSGFAHEPTNRRRRFSRGRTCILCFGEGIVPRDVATAYRQEEQRIWIIRLATFVMILLIASAIYASGHP